MSAVERVVGVGSSAGGLEALTAVVGVETKLFPQTWARVRFRAEADLDAEDFARAVRRSGYDATRIVVEPKVP